MNDERFDFRIPRELLARVDDWRQRQTVPPTRAAAMRFLIEQGLSGAFGAPELITVSREEWEHFIDCMNNPAGPTPELRRLLAEPR